MDFQSLIANGYRLFQSEKHNYMVFLEKTTSSNKRIDILFLPLLDKNIVIIEEYKVADKKNVHASLI